MSTALGSGIPSRLQLCQGLHLVILFLSLGWLLTVPKQQKKAASKAKPRWKTQGRAHNTKHIGQHLCCSPSAPQTLPTVKCPFQIAQENFKGKVLLGAPEAGGSSHHSPSKSPRALLLSLPCVQVLPSEHTCDKGRTRTPGYLRSLLQKADLVLSEPCGWHKELFHPASPQLSYQVHLKKMEQYNCLKPKSSAFSP